MTSRRAPALPPAERRQMIVDAVIPLLAEHGADVTTRQIADAAGVAEGTLFRVFEDKAALLRAVVQAMLDPELSRRSLAEIDPGLGLDAMVRTVVTEMLHSMGQVMTVLIALRGAAAVPDRGRSAGHGPPPFVFESHRILLESLTELFGRYRAELRVEPARAALLLRALVFGARHPGLGDALLLTADEIAAVLLGGIAVRTERKKR